MNSDDLRTMLDYHYWARDRMLAAVAALTPEQYTRSLGNSFTSVRDTVVHTYSAEWNWYLRWTGDSPTAMLDPERFPTLEDVKTAWTDNEQKIRMFLDTLDDAGIEKAIQYRALNGQELGSVFRHTLQHVVNHATYHRGQVTTMLRQLGAAPPESQDMIAFYRERAER
jgi:uncharacterized damage-inducible protein DinB